MNLFISGCLGAALFFFFFKKINCLERLHEHVSRSDLLKVLKFLITQYIYLKRYNEVKCDKLGLLFFTKSCPNFLKLIAYVLVRDGTTCS